MHVLHFIAYPQRMAGANRLILNLVRNLPADIDPIVVITDEGVAATAFREAGIEIRILPVGDQLNQFGKVIGTWPLWRKLTVSLRELLPYYLRLFRLFHREKIDILHIHGVRGAVFAAPVAQMLRRPVVAHLHGQVAVDGLPQVLFERLSKRIIAVSKGVVPTLGRLGQKKTTVVYSGREDVSDYGRQIGWLESLQQDKKLIVTMFASVVPFKGYHHLIEALRLLNQRGWGRRVAFIGIGDFVLEHEKYHDWLRQKICDAGVENLTFTGWQNDPFSFLRYADIAILPSVAQETIMVNGELLQVRGNEGLPVSHLEAMWFSLPLIGTDIAGVPEQIIDGENGFLIPPSDPVELANALEKLLSDHLLRQQFGASSRKLIEQRFSTTAYVTGVANEYRLAVKSK